MSLDSCIFPCKKKKKKKKKGTKIITLRCLGFVISKISNLSIPLPLFLWKFLGQGSTHATAATTVDPSWARDQPMPQQQPQWIHCDKETPAVIF